MNLWEYPPRHNPWYKMTGLQVDNELHSVIVFNRSDRRRPLIQILPHNAHSIYL